MSEIISGLFAIGMVIGCIYIAGAVLGIILNFLGSLFKGNNNQSPAKSAVGNSTFEIRLIDVNTDVIKGKRVEIKGLLPIKGAVNNLGIMVSIFDNTGETYQKVISVLNEQKEPRSNCFQHLSVLGNVNVGAGLENWTSIGGFIPELLTPPNGGMRRLQAYVRVVNMDNLPTISEGFGGKDHPGVFWRKGINFEYNFSNKGYLDAAKDRDESQALSINLAVLLAYSDGKFTDEEGLVIKDWIICQLSNYRGDERNRIKENFNSAFRSAHMNGTNGKLKVDTVTKRLNEIGEKYIKYDAIELCLDVMAADGVADKAEMKMVREVASKLGLDMEEIEKMKDSRIVTLDHVSVDGNQVENLLGIDEAWSESEIKKHLMMEFKKWNNRLNTLPEGDQRKNAQKMLDSIADARKKYVG